MDGDGTKEDDDKDLNQYMESLLVDSPLEHHQLIPAAQVYVQPDPAPPAHALPGVPHQQMKVDLQPALQLPQHQAPPTVNLQYPQPAAPAMPSQNQQMFGESPATMPRHHHHRHHMMSELMLILPPQYQQMPAAMMGDLPATMSFQHLEMLGQGDPSQAVMAHQHQQMMVDPPAAYGGQIDRILMLSPGSGEGQFVAAAPQDPHDPDGDLGLRALRIVNEEEHHPGGSGGAGSQAPALSPVVVALAQEPCEGPNSGSELRYMSLPNHTRESVPEYVASIIKRMRNSGSCVEDVINLLGGEAAASSSRIRALPATAHPPVKLANPSTTMETDVLPTPPVDAPVARPPPPAHRWEERDIMKSSELGQPNPAGATVLHRWRGMSRTEEEEETRRYLRAAAKEAEEEVTTQYPELKKSSRKKPEHGLVYSWIVKVNEKIKKCEKESRWLVGSGLSKIRRKVDEYLIEKRDLYDKFRDLLMKETKNCHDLPPRRNNDEADPSGGRSAAGAAVA